MKTKKLALLSFLACACIAGGVAGISANNVSAEGEAAKTIWMKAGASLRVPDAVETGDNFDGLRFRAYYDAEFVEAKKAEGTLSVGMFIAPAEFHKEVPLTKDNLIGDFAQYCWTDGDDTKTRILNVEGYAYKGEEDNYYTMDASIWNLKAANLDRSFIGVAYLKAGENYYLADVTDENGTNAVTVAQKALLNKSDEIYGNEEDETAPQRVEAEYITAYLGAEGKPYTYTLNVHKQTKEGAYAKTSATKEVTLTSYDAEAEVEVPANYVEYTGRSTSKLINLVGETTVDVYYNYAGNRYVILDGDTKNTWDKTYMETQNKELAWENSEDVIYEGMSMKISPNNNGWEGPVWTNGLELPAATNTLSMVVKIGSLSVPATKDEEGNVTQEAYTVTAMERFQVYVKGLGYATAYAVTDLEAEEATTNTFTPTTPSKEGIRLESGLYKIVLTFEQSANVLGDIEFKMNNTIDVTTEDGTKNIAQPAYWIDNICAEIKAVGTTDVPHVFADTLTFPAPEVIDTTIWDGETSDLTPVVKYKANNANGYSTITAKDGVYTLTPDEGVYKYDVVINGTTYTTVKGVSLVNFNTPIADREWMAAETYHTNGLGVANANVEGVKSTIVYGTFDGDTYVSDSGIADFYIVAKDTAANKTFGAVAGGSVTKVGAWVYVPNSASFTPYVMLSSWASLSKVTLSAGYHYVEFDFGKDISSSYLFDFSPIQYKNCYVQEVVLIA